MAQESDHPVAVGYEVPPASQAAERHGPYHLVRHERGGVRITGVYRTIWGRSRTAIGMAAGLGAVLFFAGTVVDTFRRRGLVIDLRQTPPVLVGTPVAHVGFGLLVLALAAWLLFRAITWRRLHRLDIDASPDELIVRQVLPNGEQLAGRWKPADVEKVVAEQYELTVRPREGAALKLIVGGPWTAALWLADRIGEATGIRTASVGRAWQVEKGEG